MNQMSLPNQMTHQDPEDPLVLVDLGLLNYQKSQMNLPSLPSLPNQHYPHFQKNLLLGL